MFKGEYTLSIAGKDPSEKLLKAVGKYENVKIFPNPSESEMNHLIHSAHINLLISFQNSGMKLKLLNSLFRGRFCVANKQMVENTGLETLCLIAETPQEIAAALESLMNVQFSSARISERADILTNQFSNVENARTIIRLL
ncbi:MAG: glycosyltransferase [Saprospiraceae bacterium]|nr:glycosyltransferase [Saprospiraceae bacterium]